MDNTFTCACGKELETDVWHSITCIYSPKMSFKQYLKSMPKDETFWIMNIILVTQLFSGNLWSPVGYTILFVGRFMFVRDEQRKCYHDGKEQ